MSRMSRKSVGYFTIFDIHNLVFSNVQLLDLCALEFAILIVFYETFVVCGCHTSTGCGLIDTTGPPSLNNSVVKWKSRNTVEGLHLVMSCKMVVSCLSNCVGIIGCEFSDYITFITFPWYNIWSVECKHL